MVISGVCHWSGELTHSKEHHPEKDVYIASDLAELSVKWGISLKGDRRQDLGNEGKSTGPERAWIWEIHKTDPKGYISNRTLGRRV